MKTSVILCAVLCVFGVVQCRTLDEIDELIRDLEKRAVVTAGNPASVPKVVSQSSVFKTNFAILAADGNLETHGAACSHTANEPTPWWKADYKSPVKVTKVEILNREGFAGRLHDVVVTVDGAVCGKFKGPGKPSERVAITCAQPLVGKEVKVQIEKDGDFLTPCEIFIS